MGQKNSKLPYFKKNNFDEEPHTSSTGLVASKSLFNYDEFEYINKTQCSNEQEFQEIGNSLKSDGKNSYLKYSTSFSNGFQPYLSQNKQYGLSNVTLMRSFEKKKASSKFKTQTNNNPLENSSIKNLDYSPSEYNSLYSNSNFSKKNHLENEPNKNRQSTCSTLSSISSINSGNTINKFDLQEHMNLKVCFYHVFFCCNLRIIFLLNFRNGKYVLTNLI
jgi:hypothetical protein